MTPAVGGVPLVSIGIPAYNRPAELERAVRSALAQRQTDLEVVVSDDASSDPAVWAILVDLAATDSRLRVYRQRSNLGHAANYQWVLDEARGEYFMWLADDDWIDADYVSRCLSAFRADSSLTLVAGQAQYHRNGEDAGDERPTNLCSMRAGVRVARYFMQVTMNGPLFGVMRRADARALGFPAVLGGDWVLLGALAARGRIRTLNEVRIHRSATGLGADAARLAGGFGMHGLRARHHHLIVAGFIWRQILAGPPRYPGLGPVPRLVVASVAAASIVVRFTLADLVRQVLGPELAVALERRISALLRAPSDG